MERKFHVDQILSNGSRQRISENRKILKRFFLRQRQKGLFQFRPFIFLRGKQLFYLIAFFFIHVFTSLF